MVKYLIDNIIHITHFDTIYHGYKKIYSVSYSNNNKYVYENLFINNSTSQIKTVINNFALPTRKLVLVIENEDFTNFSFLDEINILNNKYYDIIYDANISKNNIIKTNKISNNSENSLYIKIRINNNKEMIVSKYPFEFVIFKNCLNLKNIFHIKDAKTKQINNNGISIFLINCPNFTFDINKYKECVNNNNIDLIPKIYIGNNFNFLYNYDNNTIHKLINNYNSQLNILQNDNLNNKKLIDELVKNNESLTNEINILKNILSDYLIDNNIFSNDNDVYKLIQENEELKKQLA